MKPFLGLSVGLWDDRFVGAVEDTESHPPEVHGDLWKHLDASDIADQEENAVRIAEQTVREAFRRLRARKEG